jgi:anaphase-promoting complex subunit 2
MIMPGQFQQFVFNLFFSPGLNDFDFLPIFRLQTDYAHEFTVFKPDKKLKWLPHLGTVQLELQLEDRVVDVDVPPLEAAFIELFSGKGLFSFLFQPPSFFYLLLTVNVCYPLAVWSLEDLISSVGSIDRGAAIKALSTWVDHGVLKEDPENTFILLEKAEEGDPDVGMIREARVLGSFSLVLSESLLASISFHRYGDRSADYILYI